METQTAIAQQFFNPVSLFDPAPYGFSHVVTVPGGKELIFVAGQGGEKDTEGTLSRDFRDQVAQALLNISKALEPHGLTLNAVLKLTTLVVDHDQEKLGIIIDEFKKAWPDANFPVNTLIPVPKLALEGMQVEIDAIALK